MNRSLFTWIQLALSVSNATFLVISHVPSPAAAADLAGLLVGPPGHRVIAKAAAQVNSLPRHLVARL